MDKQTDYYTPFNVETCVLLYTTPDGATNTEGVTMSISGEIATVAAPTFNQSAIDTATWTVTKTIEVTMQDNSSVIAKSHTVEIVVVPCEITATIISDMTISIGN